jgi:putative membrane protein
MLDWIVQVITTAVVLILCAKAMGSVTIKSNTTAFMVAIIVGITSGVVTFIFDVLTLGILYAVGLGVLTRIFAYAVIIEIVDQLSDGFKTKGFAPSLWLAIIIAIAGGIVDWLLL